jgi:hypothetical protein
LFVQPTMQGQRRATALCPLRERKGSAAPTFRGRVFGNQTLRNERRKIPCHRRPVLIVPASEVGATDWTEFRDEREQGELRGVNAKRPQFVVIDHGQDPGNLPGTRKHAVPGDLAAHFIHLFSLLI